jgi:hypothetical protein
MEDEQKVAEEAQLSSATAPLTWRADAGVFDDALINLLRVRDRVSIIVVLDEISRDATALLSAEGEGTRQELVAMLDRLACVAAAAVRFRKSALFDSCVNTAFSVYMSGFDESGGSRSPTGRGRHVSSPLLWLEVAKRVVAIGGLAIRRDDWRAVRLLALQIAADRHSISYGENQYWLRHAVREAANAQIFDTRKPREEDGSLIMAALRLVERERSFRPDLPEGDYRLLGSLLGFDLLSTLVISADAGGFDYRYVHPDFIYWNLHQVEPLLLRLLRNKQMRDSLFPAGVDDAFLARTVRTISEAASRYGQSWSRWSSPTVTEFLSKYPDADKT